MNIFWYRFRTLFYLHNARSMVYIILVTLHIFEIGESYLAADIEIMESISISPLQIIYAWISLLHVVTLIAFVRMAEVYDMAGTQKYILNMNLQIGFILIWEACYYPKTCSIFSPSIYVSTESSVGVHHQNLQNYFANGNARFERFATISDQLQYRLFDIVGFHRFVHHIF